MNLASRYTAFNRAARYAFVVGVGLVIIPLVWRFGVLAAGLALVALVIFAAWLVPEQVAQ